MSHCFSSSVSVAILLMPVMVAAVGCGPERSLEPDLTDFPALADRIRSLTIYDTSTLRHFKAGTIPGDEVTSTDYGLAAFKKVAESVRFEATDSAVWKGGSLGVLQLADGRRLFLALSYYGDFFRVRGVRGLFQVTGKALDDYRHRYLGHIVSEVFHPARAERNAEHRHQ